MKKWVLFIAVTSGCAVLFFGCASSKPMHERGWVGGAYLDSNPSTFKKLSANYFQSNAGVIPVLPEEIKAMQSSAVFVSRVYDHTPLKTAGIQAGDLIVAVENQKVENLKDFRRLVEQSKPGDLINAAIYRNGELKILPIKVGKETYQKWGYFHLGFRLGTELDLIPTPDFNILHLISYQTNDTRLELNSPEYQYYRQSLSLPQGESDRIPSSEADFEGWDAWLVIFGFAGKKIIISQECL